MRLLNLKDKLSRIMKSENIVRKTTRGCEKSRRVHTHLLFLPRSVRVCSVKGDSLQPSELQPSRRLCPWNFPGKNTGVGCHFLLQGIFPTRDQTCVSCLSFIGRWILHHSGTWETAASLMCGI